MSASTVTFTPSTSVLPDITQRLVTVYGTVTWTANPDTYSTGGNTLSFAGSCQWADNPPVEVKMWSAATSGPTNLYIYSYVPGTTSANGKAQIFTGAAAQTALTELSAGAVPSGVSGDTIACKVVFLRNG